MAGCSRILFYNVKNIININKNIMNYSWLIHLILICMFGT
jgi:hypothetical protein